MIRRIAKVAGARLLIMTSGLMLATAGLAALPAGPAQAATPSVVSYWGGTGYETDGSIYECGKTWDWPQGSSSVNEVYNPCDTRVWVHYVDEGDPGASGSFCVNPNGGLAYGIPLHWNGGDLSDIQLTSNTSGCDASVSVQWESDFTFANKTYNCQPGGSYTVSGLTVDQVANDCDTRIWLHGPGNSADCLNPSTGSFYYPDSSYTELQTTAVEAPCSAVLPYPY
jgi:hypothetical protein